MAAAKEKRIEAKQQNDEEIQEFLEELIKSIEENRQLLNAINDLENDDGSLHEEKTKQMLSKRLNSTNQRLEMLQESCEIKRKILEKILKKSTTSRSTSATGSNLGRPGLTPEEQDIAYELKAQMMRSTLVQNAKLKNELDMVEKVMEIRGGYKKQLETECTLSRVNLIKLMKMYEKQSKDAKSKITDLQTELKRTKGDAERYENAYRSASRQNRHRVIKRMPTKQESAVSYSTDSDHELEEKTTDKNISVGSSTKSSQSTLVDGREQYKNKVHQDSKNVCKRNETKEKSSTGLRRPQTSHRQIRQEDVMRRLEILVTENQELRSELKRVKFDCLRLNGDVKDARDGRTLYEHHLATSEASRSDLLRRVDKLQKENRMMDRCMTRQASAWIQSKRNDNKVVSDQRWNQMNNVSTVDGAKRTKEHKGKRNTDTPRTMYPPEKCAQPQRA